MSTASTPAIQLKDVHTWYGESHILHGINIDVMPGEVVPLLGRSVPSRAAYSFVTTKHPSPAMELVREWLVQEAQRFCAERAQVLPAPAA